MDTASGSLTAWNPSCGGDINALCLSGSYLAAGGSYWNIGSETCFDFSLLNI
jgi:hypothetical protein